MDGGARQRRKAEEIKRVVKSAAARRRGVLPTDEIASEANSNDEQATIAFDHQNAGTDCLRVRPESTPDSSSTWTSRHTQPSTELTSSGSYQDFWTELDALSIHNPFHEIPGNSELDRRLMMFYFDHFFPFLFPFYKPSLLEGGRTWIVQLMVCSQAMWHTTLCLSTYFISVALDGAILGHNVCKDVAWEKLLKQMGVTFEMLHRSLREIVSNNTQDVVVRTSRIMGSIMQLQRFEISVGNFENCQKHLDAAIALFRQVFRAAADVVDSGELSTLRDVLSHMGRPLWAIKSQQNGAWSSDQAAFRFYSALLLADDIVASTCMGNPPRLLEYHIPLLTNGSGPHKKPSLDLKDFIGCENWVMLQIGEIAALDAWKKSVKKVGQLDMMELVARASTIKQALLGDLVCLDDAANTPQNNWLDLFSVHNEQLPPMPGGCSAYVTRVWAHAALLYLSVVVSGWQPGSAGIRDNVVRTLALLEQMPAPELLRTMVWPFCIVGCLAEREEEYRLQAMADALVPRRLFGAARKALEIMENTWKLRDELTIDTDFAACVCSLGYVSLLV